MYEYRQGKIEKRNAGERQVIRRVIRHRRGAVTKENGLRKGVNILTGRTGEGAKR